VQVTRLYIQAARLLHLEGKPLPDEPEPWMWILCAGRPTEGLITLKCEQALSFPPGVYLAPPLLRLGIVVVNELPVNRETLLVRLLGQKAVFEQAMNELKDLPVDAPERQKVLPVMRRYYMDTENRRAGGRAEKVSGEDEEDRRITMDWVEEIEANGHSQGLVQGLTAAFSARFGALPADLRALIHKRQDTRVLQECFRFVGAASAAEAFAGLRALLKAPTPKKTSARKAREQPVGPQGGR
jgi:hypothetical protein